MNRFANTLFSAAGLAANAGRQRLGFAEQRGRQRLPCLPFLRTYWLQIAVVLCAGGLGGRRRLFTSLASLLCLEYEPEPVQAPRAGEKDDPEQDDFGQPYAPPQPPAWKSRRALCRPCL